MSLGLPVGAVMVFAEIYYVTVQVLTWELKLELR